MQYSFGSGVLYGRSTTSNVPTPIRFGGLQDVSIDFSFNVKELYGQYQFPIALGRGTGKISGKASYAQINAQALNDLFFGFNTIATGEVNTAVAEAQTITANAVTPTFAANFVADLGVVRASDGVPLTRVANTPTGLQYTCNETTGAYAFNTSLNTTPVGVSYTYGDGSGKKIAISNQLLGNAPQFLAVFTETFNGKAMTLVLNACMSSKLTLATKLEDFTIPAFEFMAFSDAGGNIGSLSTSE